MRLVTLSVCLSCLLVGALAGADRIDALLASEVIDSFVVDDLVRAVEALPEGQREGALDRIGASRKPGVVPALRRFIASRQAVDIVAGIQALAKAWPTEAADVTLVRELLGSADVRVAEAARAFAVTIHDDRAVPILIRSLVAEPTNPAIPLALQRLTRHGATEANAWSDWFDARQTRISGMVASLTAAIESEDAARIDAAMTPLLGETDGASDIADLLLIAKDHPNGLVASSAKAGLSINPAPAAVCWRASQAKRVPESVPVVAVEAPATAGTAPVIVAPAETEGSGFRTLWTVVVLGILLGGFAVLLRRKPVPVSAAPAKPGSPAESDSKKKKKGAGFTWAK